MNIALSFQDQRTQSQGLISILNSDPIQIDSADGEALGQIARYANLMRKIAADTAPDVDFSTVDNPFTGYTFKAPGNSSSMKLT